MYLPEVLSIDFSLFSCTEMQTNLHLKMPWSCAVCPCSSSLSTWKIMRYMNYLSPLMHCRRINCGCVLHLYIVPFFSPSEFGLFCCFKVELIIRIYSQICKRVLFSKRSIVILEIFRKHSNDLSTKGFICLSNGGT